MKASFPSKKVLVTCASSSMGKILLAALKARNLTVVETSLIDLDWSDAQDVDSFIEHEHPYLVVNNFAIDPQHRDQHSHYSRNIAVACTKIKSRVIHLSDYHVFGAKQKNTYFETDQPAPLSPFGETLMQSEQFITEQVERHMILRFSWLLDTEGNNVLTRLLAAFKRGKPVKVSEDYFGAPTWVDDAARVIVAITQQIFEGAENWGVFHYCSGDKCSEWEFAQQVLNTYYQLNPSKSLPPNKVEELLKAVPYNQRRDFIQHSEPKSTVLSCRRIRNNFGIQTRTWRQGLKIKIRTWQQAQGIIGEPTTMKDDNKELTAARVSGDAPVTGTVPNNSVEPNDSNHKPFDATIH